MVMEKKVVSFERLHNTSVRPETCMKSLLIVAVSILVFARGEAQPSTPSTSLTLRAAVNNALSNNPALK